MIQIFHINDAEDLPRNELEDRHRLLPGLGILPLREIVSAFRRIGYDKVASVEIFRPEYWARDPFELARAAKAAAERSEEHTSELQSLAYLVCRLLLEKKNNKITIPLWTNGTSNRPPHGPHYHS